MQESNIIFQKAVGRAIQKERKRRKLKFTIFCYENDIPTTTLYMIEKGKNQSYASNLYKIVFALGLTPEEFGRLLQNELPEGFSFHNIEE